MKNNLEKKHPQLSKEWDKEKNGNKLPRDFQPASNKYAWWICPICDHGWNAKISNRSVLKRGCPVCANKVVAPGKNDLATTHPKLASEWHPSKNDHLTPEQVTYGSAKKRFGGNAQKIMNTKHRFSTEHMVQNAQNAIQVGRLLSLNKQLFIM